MRTTHSNAPAPQTAPPKTRSTPVAASASPTPQRRPTPGELTEMPASGGAGRVSASKPPSRAAGRLRSYACARCRLDQRRVAAPAPPQPGLGVVEDGQQCLVAGRPLGTRSTSSAVTRPCSQWRARRPPCHRQDRRNAIQAVERGRRKRQYLTPAPPLCLSDGGADVVDRTPPSSRKNALPVPGC